MGYRVGLLVGRERSFPEALASEIHRRDPGVEAALALVDATRIERPPTADVLVDRISHEVTCYQPVLKLAALAGTHVINNPFWRIADDKFFNTALAQRLGVAVPRTILLPSKDYGPDITAGSLRNLKYPIDWQAIVDELGLPIFIKPHWGGGWRDVHRVTSMQELLARYDKTGKLTMIAQQAISWTQYVRCIVIGKNRVLPALWDPRQSHFDRYVKASETMPPLDEALLDRVTRDAITLCTALGYEMNTVEFAVADGVPYAIDFMNSAPDFDISSLGEAHFRWVVGEMAELCVRLCREGPPAQAYSWSAILTAR